MYRRQYALRGLLTLDTVNRRMAAPTTNSDAIAAVVIGRNEGKRLVNCLASIRADLKYVVYVDSGSTDESAQTAQRLGASVVGLDPAKPFTAARARNEGFSAVQRLWPDIRWVQFIDGDCELDSAWLKTAIDFIRERNDVAVVCGRRRERYPMASVYNRICDLEWDTPTGETSACGGDALMRVEAFAGVRGFNPQVTAGEEPELCLRLRTNGWKVWRLDAEMTRHDAAMTRFGQWWLRAVRTGYGMTEVLDLYKYSRSAIWWHQWIRSILWGALLPVVIAAGALIHPAMLLATLIYPLQVSRIAIRRGPASSFSWAYGLLMTLSRFAEVQGIIRYNWRRLHRGPIALIEYK